MKCSETTRLSDSPTFELMTGVRASTIDHYVSSLMVGLLFMLFSIYKMCNGSEYETL